MLGPERTPTFLSCFSVNLFTTPVISYSKFFLIFINSSSQFFLLGFIDKDFVADIRRISRVKTFQTEFEEASKKELEELYIKNAFKLTFSTELTENFLDLVPASARQTTRQLVRLCAYLIERTVHDGMNYISDELIAETLLTFSAQLPPDEN